MTRCLACTFIALSCLDPGLLPCRQARNLQQLDNGKRNQCKAERQKPACLSLLVSSHLRLLHPRKTLLYHQRGTPASCSVCQRFEAVENPVPRRALLISLAATWFLPVQQAKGKLYVKRAPGAAMCGSSCGIKALKGTLWP